MAQEQTTTGSSDFPQAWRFDEDGLRIEGHYVRLDEGPTEYGRRLIVVLDVDGEERALWLAQEVLRRRFAEELERRAAADFTAGELIVVERASEKKESEAGRSYWPFSIEFPDAPRRSAADRLGVGSTGEPEAPSPSVTEDDDLPF